MRSIGQPDALVAGAGAGVRSDRIAHQLVHRRRRSKGMKGGCGGGVAGVVNKLKSGGGWEGIRVLVTEREMRKVESCGERERDRFGRAVKRGKWRGSATRN